MQILFKTYAKLFLQTSNTLFSLKENSLYDTKYENICKNF